MKAVPIAITRTIAIAAFLTFVAGSSARCLAQDSSAAEPTANETELLKTITQLSERLDKIEAADAAAKKDKDEKAKAEAKKPAKPTVNWTGQLQMDSYGFTQSPANDAQYGNIDNGTAFRRARLGAFGDYGLSEYRIEMDFALSGRPSFLDVFTGVKEVPVLGTVRAGHFFEPFSLERITANRFTVFMERSLVDQAFVPARNTGVMARNQFFDSRVTSSLGIFRSSSDVFGDDAGDRFETAITSRTTGLLWYRDYCGTLDYFHVGSAYSYRGANQGQLRFSAQPESRLGAITTNNVPVFVDTGFFAANTSQLFNAEAAWIRGPLMLSGEYVGTTIDAVGRSVNFGGGYVSGTYFLTGESRPYNRQTGAFDRVIPRRNFIDADGKRIGGGAGAWELASRMSRLDLNDPFVQGGRVTDYTAGLNWYLNPYLRWTFNYIHSIPDRNGIQSTANIYASRIGFDF